MKFVYIKCFYKGVRKNY